MTDAEHPDPRVDPDGYAAWIFEGMAEWGRRHPPTLRLPEPREPIVEAARHGVFVDYRQYLSTVWWQRTKRRAIGKAGRRCQVTEDGNRCTNRSKLQVHHRHYETLGREDPATDLVVVCPKHHRLIHGITKTKH